ncbi:ATP-dependent acyl-CoA ligase [Gordonia sp. TBRC 11910]|uniref:ATP-dependent acyl-CoA ligase n=1 Tax=Gordonia asplenii TaxID=2725283 RepID=A0A848KTH2_9ACTN|nr:AMP-binding protein [Gordonia asplenii]NMO02234.1 ATP-dependent acyl-CoA ligase [Gordonia asplenii]
MTNPVETLTGVTHPSVPELFSARVRQTPDALFLRHEGRTWSYTDALAEIQSVAGWLPSVGDSPARVAGFLPNRPEAVWAWLGTLYAGAAYVSLHRAHRGAVLHDMITRSKAEVLVTDAEGLADLPDLAGTAVHTVVVAGDWSGEHRLQSVVVGWDRAAADATPGHTSEPVRDGAAIAGIIYTSGTTGRSKAVPLQHSHLTRGAGWVCDTLGLTGADVLHMWMPLYHIAGQLDALLAIVVAGGSVAQYPTFSASKFWDQVAESGATVFGGFTNVLEILSSSDAPPDGATLRVGVAGGIPPALHRPLEERLGVRLYDVYGMTEAEPILLPPSGERVPPGSCGRPNPDLTVALLDADGNRCPTGTVGEISVRANIPGVMTPGYDGDDAAWRAATTDGWFRTGDFARQDSDGYFFFVDRVKHAIRRRGENVSSWELEQIVGGHPGVEECCAVGVPAALGGHDIKLVVAPTYGIDLDPAELSRWCTEHMAAFMRPRYIEIVTDLPRNDVGKVLKTELSGLGATVWDSDAESEHQTTRLRVES